MRSSILATCTSTRPRGGSASIGSPQWPSGWALAASSASTFPARSPGSFRPLHGNAARLATGSAVVPHLAREPGIMIVDGGADHSAFPSLGLNAKDLALVLDGMNAVV